MTPKRRTCALGMRASCICVFVYTTDNEIGETGTAHICNVIANNTTIQKLWINSTSARFGMSVTSVSQRTAYAANAHIGVYVCVCVHGGARRQTIASLRRGSKT